MKRVKYLVAAILVMAGLSLSLVSEIMVAHTVHTPATSLIADADEQPDPEPDRPQGGFWG